ncbi:MAG: protein-L-isoaspartate(D-aspartate) O-methyltransferase [Candidatus Limnocylindria bacterium]
MRWPRFSRPHNAGGEHARDRARMVAEQLEARGITDAELLRAFGAVERHLFVEGNEPYGDHALPVGEGQTISQPYVVAVMTATAKPASGWNGANVLEVGTGSGYQAALLAEMGANVTSIERHEPLANTAQQRLAQAGYEDRVEVVVGDGTQGWAAHAPYRSILVTAGGPSVPQPLVAQLDPDGGRLVIPVGDREHQYLTLVVREGDAVTTTELEAVVFVPLIGEHGHRAD